jgi:acetyl esterase/lipase
VRNVVQPTLTIFNPPNSKRATHTAVIIAPGGGFRWLSIDSEGYDVARRLAAKGVTAIVLKYRLQHTADDEQKFREESLAFLRGIAQGGPRPASAPSTPRLELSPDKNPGIADGIAAVRYVRDHAAELSVSRDRIGMVGFSAGGAVTCGIILHGDEDARLDFAAPIYGAFIPEAQWPANTPPMFLAVAADDPIAASAEINSFTSLHAQDHSVELHVFESGGHGFGVVLRGLTTDMWIDEFNGWLAAKGLLTP